MMPPVPARRSPPPRWCRRSLTAVLETVRDGVDPALPGRRLPTVSPTRCCGPELAEWCTTLPVELPLGVVHVFLSCWIRLYGMVCMEVLGHLRFALDDTEPVFEAELRTPGEVLRVVDQYAPPSS
jgi:hypothetical protein